MKITLDIPDTTVCAFFDFVHYTRYGMAMQGHSIASDELFDGAEIVVEQKDGDDGRKHKPDFTNHTGDNYPN